EAMNVNIYDDDLSDNIELNDVGYLIALTANDAINNYALINFSAAFGEHGSFKIATLTDIANATDAERVRFFTPKDDYINLSEAFRENPKIHQIKIATETDYNQILESLGQEEKSVLLFVENGAGLYLISEFERDNFPKKGLTLSYLGKQIEIKS
ncbi:MAG: cell shape-determining protein, partial [Flavobacteriaceae bacterium CG_4_8_14_3_um_filter_31_8]